MVKHDVASTFEELSLLSSTLKILKRLTGKVDQSDLRRIFIRLSSGEILKVSRSVASIENRAEVEFYHRVRDTSCLVPPLWHSANYRLVLFPAVAPLADLSLYPAYEKSMQHLGLYLCTPESTTEDYRQLHYPYVYKKPSHS